ncbi:MAG: Fic family protein [Atribacterota bacterium]|nr:Fic family protein [Atribacterota bacterium]
MFEPKFKYTNKIVKLLTRISAARETILNSPLIPKWNIALRQEAIIHSAHSSTSIEGNRLSLEQVSELARGREIAATRRDKQEVVNYLDVLKNIKNLIKDNSITEKVILNIHRMVTKNTLDNPADSGVYRNRYVVVANRFTGEIFFKPPQNQEVAGLVKDLISWINSEESKELDPVIEAGIVHYELVRIHLSLMVMVEQRESWLLQFSTYAVLIPISSFVLMIIMILTDQHTTKHFRALNRIN